ncbi:MAG: hypothetical protein R3C40_02400 [Parvularculaceae bacterium]
MGRCRASAQLWAPRPTPSDERRASGSPSGVEPGRACCALAHGAKEGALDDADTSKQMPLAAIKILKPLLEDPSVLKIGQNIKYDMLVMSRYSVEIAPIDDLRC